MERPGIQLRLASIFWTTAAIAFVVAVCASAAHGDRTGFVVTHFAAAGLCFATCAYRLRRGSHEKARIWKS